LTAFGKEPISISLGISRWLIPTEVCRFPDLIIFIDESICGILENLLLIVELVFYHFSPFFYNLVELRFAYEFFAETWLVTSFLDYF
jgi:hypothetical protein